MKIKLVFIGLLLTFNAVLSYSAPDNVALLVWANEAIVSTYTTNYKTFAQDQKRLAQYFTTEGWIAYSKALNASKLPEAIQKNAYEVSSVASAPPQLAVVDQNHWTVTMPILVQYKNPQYQQQQSLNIVLGITLASPGQGIRGYAITSLKSSVTKPPCQCMSQEESTPAPSK
ncbi:DotI/IcmL family type IV secretion protein [Legionella sp. km772]|uniref:DotI/IcmL family type IV secretion protein n=1 Tax=Legionella sp. km772 TaxID=2498111 RepID=UPI000F8EA807|nr:DotI/IcmL family type IV secretion protein [Legionella sp. km772]RUR12890.1 type IV secretion protein IcmL [Legionella sp. km772]